ncbi:MAG: hypothetical protein ACR2QA_18075 [Solirubrobacteraceae bacterium]
MDCQSNVSGQYSARVSPSQNSSSLPVTQVVPVTSGQTYTVSLECGTTVPRAIAQVQGVLTALVAGS